MDLLEAYYQILQEMMETHHYHYPLLLILLKFQDLANFQLFHHLLMLKI
jgi:hypothetical protein